MNPDSLSPWRVWLHPKHAFRTIVKLSIASDELLATQHDLKTSQTSISQLKTELENIKGENKSLQKRLQDTLLTVDQFSKLIETQRIQIDEYRDTEDRLQQFMSELKKVEEMKRRYDMRIHRLQAQLAQAIHANPGACVSELEDPEPIQMTAVSTPNGIHTAFDNQHSANCSKNPGNDSDWLISLEQDDVP